MATGSNGQTGTNLTLPGTNFPVPVAGGGGGGAGSSGGSGGLGGAKPTLAFTTATGGTGGAGGVHGLVITSSGTNTLTGVGGTAGGAGNSGTNGGGGGGGGAGGFGVVVTSAANTVNITTANVTGGTGGGGGNSGATLLNFTAGGDYLGQNGANGGDGGYGFYALNANSGTLNNLSALMIRGGNGGAGGAGGNLPALTYSETYDTNAGAGGNGAAGGNGVGANGSSTTNFTINNGNSNASQIVGGNGGNGGSGGSVASGAVGGAGGVGGNGGFGAAGSYLTVNNSSSAAITGGGGGTGGGSGSGASSADRTFDGAGGAGGAGGSAIFGTLNTISNSGTLTGGTGGNGGNGTRSNGGSGGAGGAGIFAISSSITNNGSGNVIGGAGGSGGGSSAGSAGSGGGGGYGLLSLFSTLSNSGGISGGAGGSGAGIGGAGISALFSNLFLFSGAISGGNGGAGGGVGGAGIYAGGVNVALGGGSVTGGLGNAGSGARADAFTFFAGDNTLTLNGGAITGNIGVGGAGIGGTLALTVNSGFSSGMLSNAVTLNEAGTKLTIQQGSNATLSGAISGLGSVVIANTSSSAIVTFTGNNTYKGSTTINAGSRLNIGDGIAPVSMNIGKVFNYGTTNLTTNSSVKDDFFNFGTATIAGTLNANVINTSSYTIDPGGTWIGNFLINSGSFVNNGTWTKTAVAIGSEFSLNGNQQQVAGGLSNYVNAITPLPVSFLPLFLSDNMPYALSQLSGEAATGSKTSAVALTGQFLNLMVDPLAGGGAAPFAGATAFAAEQQPLPASVAQAYASVLKAPANFNTDRRWEVWAAGFGGAQNISGNAAAGSTAISARTYGAAAGAHYRTSDTMLGFALGGGGSSWGLEQALGGGTGDSFLAGFYGRTQFGGGYVSGALAFANHWMETDRSTLGGNQLKASYTGQSYAGRLETGHRVALQQGSGLTPYAAVQAQYTRTPSYQETDVNASGFALGYNSNAATDLRSELGTRFDAASFAYGIPLALRMRAAWAHNWINDNTMTAAFVTLPGMNFSVNGVSTPKDSVLASVESEFSFASNWSFAARLDSELSPTSSSFAGTGKLRHAW